MSDRTAQKPAEDFSRKAGPPHGDAGGQSEGISDQAARRPAWKYVLIAVVFTGWVAFLVYCAAAGR